MSAAERTVSPERTAAIFAAAVEAARPTGDFPATARRLFDLAKELIGATAGYVALRDDVSGLNVALFLDAGGAECTVDPSLPMPIRGLRETAYRTGEPTFENDFHHSQWMRFMPAGHARLENVLFAPLVVDSDALGLIGLANKPGGFTQLDAENAAFFGRLAAMSLANVRATDRLQASETRLRTLLDSSNVRYSRLVEGTSDIVTVVDAEGRLTYLNERGRTFFGLDEPSASLPSAFDVIHEDDRQHTVDWFHEAADAGVAVSSIENRQINRFGEPRDIHWSSVFTYDESGRVAQVDAIGTDVTDQRRSERLAALVESLYRCDDNFPLAEILVAALDGVCAILCSPIGFYHFVEADEETLSLQAWSTDTTERFCEAAGAGTHYPLSEAGVWADCVRERRPVVHNSYATLPNRRGLPEGHAEVVREVVVPVFREGRIVAIIGVGNCPREYTAGDVDMLRRAAEAVRDLVERRRQVDGLRASRDLALAAQKALRAQRDQLGEIAARIARENEEERRRIALELHEDIGQVLAVTKIGAQAIAQDADSRHTAEAAQQLTRLIERTLSQVRSLTESLSPLVLADLGLARALEWMVDHLSESTGFRCDLEMSDVPEHISDEVAAIVYRAAHELVEQVRATSDATTASVRLEVRGGDTIVLTVTGEGPDSAEGLEDDPNDDAGALWALVEDLRRVGGTLRIQNSPSAGTCATVVVPLNPAD